MAIPVSQWPGRASDARPDDRSNIAIDAQSREELVVGGPYEWIAPQQRPEIEKTLG